MAASVLEQILNTSKRAAIDTYVYGTIVLYTPPPSNNFGFGMHSNARFTDNTATNNRFERQSTLNDYGLKSYETKPLWESPKAEPLPISQPLEIVPYKKGMELDGGVSLYGNKSTAILTEQLGDGYSYSIHHHNKGGGAIELVFHPVY